LMGDDSELVRGANTMIEHVPTIKEGKLDGRLLVLITQIELARQILDPEELEFFNDTMEELLKKIEDRASDSTEEISYTKTASQIEIYAVDMSVTDENMKKYFGGASGKRMGILHDKLETLGFTVKEEKREKPLGRSTYRYWLEVKVNVSNDY